MKKIFRNTLMLSILFSSAMFVSCNEDDATLDEKLSKPKISIAQNTFVVTEGEDAVINMTTSNPINRTMEFKVELITGSTGSFRDYVTSGTETTPDDGQGVIGHRFSFPAMATEYSISITPIIDLLPEGAEVLKLRLYSMGNSNGTIDEVITIDVADYVSNDVGIELDYAAAEPDYFGTLVPASFIGADGAAHYFVESYDFDFYVFDSSLALVSAFDAATSNNPEFWLFDNAALPDGDYYIVVDLYDGVDQGVSSGPASRTKIPVTLTVGKYGTWRQVIDLPYYSDNATSAPDGLNGGEMIGAILTKTGTTYVLKDENDNILNSGKMASIQQKIQNIKLNKANRK